MRKRQSDAEIALWQKLRAHRMLGYKFRRQVVIEPYIVDFVCLEAMLIIEADGGQHTEQQSYDEQRAAHLESLGYRVLRFWNHEILNELDSVLTQIASALIRSPLPNPPPEGEGV
jgi:very-short-patch-repair endonuclease